MNREMTDIKIEPDGLLIPPQYLDGLGPTAIVRRIKGGLIVESLDQAQAREELRALVERIGAMVKSDANRLALVRHGCGGKAMAW